MTLLRETILCLQMPLFGECFNWKKLAYPNLVKANANLLSYFYIIKSKE